MFRPKSHYRLHAPTAWAKSITAWHPIQGECRLTACARTIKQSHPEWPPPIHRLKPVIVVRQFLCPAGLPYKAKWDLQSPKFPQRILYHASLLCCRPAAAHGPPLLFPDHQGCKEAVPKPGAGESAHQPIVAGPALNSWRRIRRHKAKVVVSLQERLYDLLVFFRFR